MARSHFALLAWPRLMAQPRRRTKDGFRRSGVAWMGQKAGLTAAIMNGGNRRTVWLKWIPPPTYILVKTALTSRHTRAAKVSFVHTTSSVQCSSKSMLADLIPTPPLFSPACMCLSPSTSYYAWREYNVLGSEKVIGAVMPTADLWAQLYSLEMTSKPYFREQKHVYLDNLFLCIPSVASSVVPWKQKQAQKETKTPSIPPRRTCCPKKYI